MKALKLFSFCFFLFLSSCFFRKDDFSLAKKFLKKGLCKEAYTSFLNVKKKTKKHKKFAFLASSNCQQRHGQSHSASLFYENLLNEDLKQKSFLSLKENRQIKLKLAQMSFYDLKNYRKAIKYYKESLKLNPHPQEKISNQYQIAVSFFYLKKYNQSLVELKKIFLQKQNLQAKEKSMILKGRILIAQKNFEKAIPFFKDLIVQYPKKEFFFREYLAFIYEEKKEFLLAIREMEKIEPPSSFTRSKIQSLYERLQNQPGVNL